MTHVCNWADYTILYNISDTNANSRSIFLSDGRYVSATTYGTVNIWNLRTRVIEATLPVSGLAFEELDNYFLAVSGQLANITIWNLLTKSLVRLIPTSFKYSALRQLKNEILVAGTFNGQMHFFNITNGVVVYSIRLLVSKITAFEESAFGQLMASNLDYHYGIWNLTSLSQQYGMNPINGPLTYLKMIDYDKFIVAGESNRFCINVLNYSATESPYTNIVYGSNCINLPLQATKCIDMKTTKSKISILAIDNNNIAFFNLTSLSYSLTLSSGLSSPIMSFAIKGNPFSFL